MSEQKWEACLGRLYNLRRDNRGSCKRPHKPVLLLSIMDLLDRGVIVENKVPLSDELVRTFKRYFEVMRQGDDQPAIQNPFFHLCGDKFWELVPVAGEPARYRPGSTSGAPSVAELRRRAAYGRFMADFWSLLRGEMPTLQPRCLAGDSRRTKQLNALPENLICSFQGSVRAAGMTCAPLLAWSFRL